MRTTIGDSVYLAAVAPEGDVLAEQSSFDRALGEVARHHDRIPIIAKALFRHMPAFEMPARVL